MESVAGAPNDWKCQVRLEKGGEGSSSGAAGGLVHRIGHTESITACDAGFKISIFIKFLNRFSDN